MSVWFGPSPNFITILAKLILLTSIIICTLEFGEMILPVGNALIHGIPLIVTYIITYSVADILNAIFNWFMSNHPNVQNAPNDDDLRLAAANTLNGISFAIKTTSPTPGLLPTYSNSFNVDPLTPCGPGDESCPELLQDRFRFMWIQGAANVLINGVTKQLASNWGDDLNVFGLSIICNPKDPPNFPGFNNFTRRSLLNTGPMNVTIMNLSKAVEKDSWLENRWIAEVISLEQDSLNETTILTVNFVQILAFNSICEDSINAGNFKLCYSTIGKKIPCFMNTHVENVSSVPAGCNDKCAAVKGWAGLNDERINYSSPKPVYGDYMHKSLAIYGGHILMPQCIENSVGCVNSNENNVSQVQNRFAELMYGIIASGVMARRSLLSNSGIMLNVQNVEKGVAGIKIMFEKGYRITVIAIIVLCWVAFICWLICAFNHNNCIFNYDFDHDTQLNSKALAVGPNNPIVVPVNPVNPIVVPDNPVNPIVVPDNPVNPNVLPKSCLDLKYLLLVACFQITFEFSNNFLICCIKLDCNKDIDNNSAKYKEIYNGADGKIVCNSAEGDVACNNAKDEVTCNGTKGKNTCIVEDEEPCNDNDDKNTCNNSESNAEGWC
ncbi:9719_t:CDS:2 [Racocetra fulgida]|uniref:9719_t:CDS:1 n=1 Tax=Racocetra fulgida TaxID=60492 RepID=A0A9N9A4Q0_9GLOM|nr:9719_t:CDS:2 [Racocetra fulgida]